MYKLLIVDDEALIREGLTAMIDWDNLPLQPVGSVADGLEAYEFILKQQPDIILTDIRMPEMDGLCLIEKSLIRYPNLKFILLSGYDDFEYAHTAMRFGVRHYLLKPSSNQELNSALTSVIQELEQLRETQNLIHSLFSQIKEENVRLTFLEKIMPLLHQNNPHALQNELQAMAEYINQKTEMKVSYSNITEQILKEVNLRLTDPDLNLTYLANHVLYMNKDYIGKQFKKEIGQSFSEYLTVTRMEKAIELIKTLKMEQINQLPTLVGYKNNPSYFYRLFKTYTGKTPHQYKKAY